MTLKFAEYFRCEYHTFFCSKHPPVYTRIIPSILESKKYALGAPGVEGMLWKNAKRLVLFGTAFAAEEKCVGVVATCCRLAVGLRRCEA
jgi:hypothetical protein